MDHSLPQLWHSAADGAFLPAVGKSAQFYVGFFLLLIGLVLSAFFALNRSAVSLPLVGIPASAVIAFGTVYMFCAVGVYV